MATLAQDWQLKVGDLVLGPGTPYMVHDLEGLGAPGYRISDVPRPQDHGEYPGADYLAGRDITLRVSIHGASPEDVVALCDALLAAWRGPQPPTPGAVRPLTFRMHGGSERRLTGRPRRAAVQAKVVGHRVEALLEYHAWDPRLYAEDLAIGNTGLPEQAGGHTFPLLFPWVFGAAGSVGTVLAVNAGNFPTRPVAVITGPAAGPRLENVTTGESLLLDYTLGAGSTLVIDFDARTVLEGGSSSRYYALLPGSKWWELVPGVNEVRFRANAYDPSARLDLSWRSAWL